jgi:hypothetical protein
LVLGLWLGATVTACTLLHASRVPEIVRTTTHDRVEVWKGIEQRWPIADDGLAAELWADSSAWEAVERGAGNGAPEAFVTTVRTQKVVTAESARRIGEFSPTEKADLVRALRESWERLGSYYR